jgi:hypothetical protein
MFDREMLPADSCAIRILQGLLIMGLNGRLNSKNTPLWQIKSGSFVLTVPGYHHVDQTEYKVRRPTYFSMRHIFPGYGRMTVTWRSKPEKVCTEYSIAHEPCIVDIPKCMFFMPGIGVLPFHLIPRILSVDPRKNTGLGNSDLPNDRNIMGLFDGF